MRRMTIAALMLLGACGHKEEAKDAPALISIDNGAGEIRRDGLKMGDLNLSIDPNSAQCAKRPDYAPLFYDAKVESCASIGKGGQVAYTTTAVPSQLKDFYKQAAADAKLTASVFEQEQMFGANDGKGRNLTVMMAPQGGRTTVNLIYGAIAD